MRIDAPIITGSFSLNGSILQNLSAVSTTGSNTFVGNQNVQGYVSASALTGSIDFTNLTNSPTLVSGSSQVVNILSSLNTATASFTPRISNLESKSSSVDISITNINSFTASNANQSLNSKTGSYATTGSNTFFGTQTFSGSVYIANDLIVQGSSSIQYISASSVSIGTNIIQLNTANPSVRFAGLTIIDSGSIGGSGSFLYDSVHDEFVFVHRGNGTNITSSHFVLGPETYDNLGNELYLTCNTLSKGTGKEHLIDSCIFDNGTTTCIKNNLVGTGTMSGTTIYGSTVVCSAVGLFSGCVGIGTSLPSTKLHIEATGPTRGIIGTIKNTTQTGAQVHFVQDSVADWVIGQPANTNAFAFWNNRYPSNDGTEIMRITCTGNVGIGTCSPFSNAKLQVNVGTNINFAVQPGTACTTGIKLNTFVDSGASNIPLELNGNILYLKTCENSRLLINGNGVSCFACQVYVGTDKLCWTDNVFKTLQVGNGAFNNAGTQTQIVNNVYYDDTNYRSLIGGPSNRLIMTGPGDLIFEYACTQAVGCIVSLSPKLFVCGINGRVGIGTSTPNSKLHIYGSDSELGIQVAKNGSDSVGSGPYIAIQNLANSRQWITQLTADNHLATYYWGGSNYTERYRFNTGGSFTVPGQPAMLAQPGATNFTVGSGTHAYGWCTSGSVRYNCGFTFTSATAAATNVADAGATGKIIIPADGRYILQFSQRNEGQTTSDGQFFLWVNGTQRIRRHIELWNGKPYIHVDVTAVLSLSTNDTLEMGAWFNSSGRTDTFSGTADQVNWMSLAKIS